MQRLHCGIDLGSTNVKVVLVDDDGRAVNVRSVPTPRVEDGEGVATDAPALIASLESMIIEAWAASGAGAPLRSIAVAGVGEDGLGVRADLTPTGLALPWFDRRGTREAQRLRAFAAGDARTGIDIGPDRTAAKWLWLKEHRPRELADARHWIALTDYPAVWWTGRPFMTSSLAARTACFDVYARRWIDELLVETGAPPLPPLLGAGEPAGTVTRGPLLERGVASDDTVVAAGGHDHPIAALAIRNLIPSARVDSMGTANLVYGEAAGPVKPYLDPYVAFSVPPRTDTGLACLGVYELSAALLGEKTDPDDLMALLAERRLPGDAWTPAGGTQPASDASPRRRLEQATFYARRMFEAMNGAGAPAGPIYATGGWANSTAFLELRASIFGTTIHAIAEPELTAVGAACVGALASDGRRPDLLATRAIRTVDPVPSWVETYRDVYPSIRADLDATAARRLA